MRGARKTTIVSREITDLMCDRMQLLSDYDKLKEINNSYRDRRLEAKVASYTKKIKVLEDVRKRIENERYI